MLTSLELLPLNSLMSFVLLHLRDCSLLKKLWSSAAFDRHPSPSLRSVLLLLWLATDNHTINFFFISQALLCLFIIFFPDPFASLFSPELLSHCMLFHPIYVLEIYFTFSFIYVCLYVGMCLQRSEESIICPGAETAGSFEPPVVGART